MAAQRNATACHRNAEQWQHNAMQDHESKWHCAKMTRV
jgi:hypothetical protein